MPTAEDIVVSNHIPFTVMFLFTLIYWTITYQPAKYGTVFLNKTLRWMINVYIGLPIINAYVQQRSDLGVSVYK